MVKKLKKSSPFQGKQRLFLKLVSLGLKVKVKARVSIDNAASLHRINKRPDQAKIQLEYKQNCKTGTT